MRRCVYFLCSALILLASCTPGPTQIPPTPTPTQTASPAPTFKPTETETPAATPIPGFEDWSVFNPGAVDIQTDGDALVLTLTRRALWFMGQRGVLLYKPVSGDFMITGKVYTSKQSDPSQSPGGNGTVQLGGLMVPSGEGGPENCVFIVLGDDGDGISTETKNTVDNFSEYDGPAWDLPNAELHICRLGQALHLHKRHIGSEEAWMPAATFERADLPETVQVGVNIYSDNTPDLQVRYESVSIDAVSDAAACETP